jgi:ribosomal protein S18 acetylase RimI-like enzyme
MAAQGVSKVIILKQVDPSGAMDFKTVRLAALKDSPFAFGSTHEAESRLTDDDWRRRAAERDGTTGITYLAWDGDTPCGIAAGFISPENTIHVVSVWVAPSHRMLGVGRLLIRGIADWASARSVPVLSLMVTSNNRPAINLYRRLGFKMTGEMKPYSHDPQVVMFQMNARVDRLRIGLNVPNAM